MSLHHVVIWLVYTLAVQMNVDAACNIKPTKLRLNRTRTIIMTPHKNQKVWYHRLIPIKALFLPEASDYIGSSSAETISLARSVQQSEFVQGLQQAAKDARLPISVGIHEPAQGGSKVKNTLIWINENGYIAQRYQKIHLFDVDIKDGPVLRESA